MPVLSTNTKIVKTMYIVMTHTPYTAYVYDLRNKFLWMARILTAEADGESTERIGVICIARLIVDEEIREMCGGSLIEN